jgi:hypothetical protein
MYMNTNSKSFYPSQQFMAILRRCNHIYCAYSVDINPNLHSPIYPQILFVVNCTNKKIHHYELKIMININVLDLIRVLKKLTKYLNIFKKLFIWALPPHYHMSMVLDGTFCLWYEGKSCHLPSLQIRSLHMKIGLTQQKNIVLP